jgi:hypothetical protein
VDHDGLGQPGVADLGVANWPHTSTRGGPAWSRGRPCSSGRLLGGAVEERIIQVLGRAHPHLSRLPGAVPRGP